MGFTTSRLESPNQHNPMSEKIKTVADLMDVVMKGAVTLALAAGALLYNGTKEEIEKLRSKSDVTAERLATLESWARSSEQRQDRVEAMVSEILKIARDSK